jgi:hypothetical protein
MSPVLRKRGTFRYRSLSEHQTDRIRMKITHRHIIIKSLSWTGEAYACNPSCPGDRDQEGCSSTPPWANSS